MNVKGRGDGVIVRNWEVRIRGVEISECNKVVKRGIGGKGDGVVWRVIREGKEVGE